MIKKIDNSIQNLTIALSILFSNISFILLKYFELSERPIFYLIAVISVIILLRLSMSGFKKLINKSIWLRNMILGSAQIEGWWTASIKTKSNGIYKTSHSIFNIHYKDGILGSNGQAFDEKGDFLRSWKTTSSRYEDYCLEFIFEGEDAEADAIDFYGYGKYKFIKGKSVPLNFSGFILDNYNPQKRLLYARKITDSNQLKNIDQFKVRRKIIASNKKNLAVRSI